VVTVVVLVVCALMAGAGSIAYCAKRDIDYAQKCGAGQCWGYVLRQQMVTGKVTLRFWGSWGLNWEYVFPAGVVRRVTEGRWLGTDRAILVNLRWSPEKEGAGEVPVKVLYDYQRGTVAVWSPLALWRMADYRSARGDQNWLDEKAFRAEVEAIEP
jgi:hypothetical protein